MTLVQRRNFLLLPGLIFTSMFACQTAAASPGSDCLRYSGTWLEELRTHTVHQETSLPEYEQQISNLRLEKDVYLTKLRELGVDVSLKAETTQDARGPYNLETSIGLAANVDLNFWLRTLERKINLNRVKKTDMSIYDIQQNQRQEIISDLLSYSAAVTLLKIFYERRGFLEKQREYYSVEQESGINRSTEVLENELQLSELYNKTLGAQTKVELSLLNLGVNAESLKGKLINFENLEPIKVTHCLKRPMKESIADLERLIASQDADLRRQSEGPRLTSSFSILSNGQGRPEGKIGVMLNVPIYSGGTRATRERRLEQSVSQATQKLRLLRFELDKATREREALDKLTKSTIDIVTRRIRDSNQVLNELAERSRLGQSTFDTRNSRKIELSIQREAIIRIKKDFYQSIVDYSALMGNL